MSYNSYCPSTLPKIQMIRGSRVRCGWHLPLIKNGKWTIVQCPQKMSIYHQFIIDPTVHHLMNIPQRNLFLSPKTKNINHCSLAMQLFIFWKPVSVLVLFSFPKYVSIDRLNFTESKDWWKTKVSWNVIVMKTDQNWKKKVNKTRQKTTNETKVEKESAENSEPMQQQNFVCASFIFMFVA